MALPVLTTGADVDAIVAYLKTKPTGATLEEAKAVMRKQALDGRKLAAYEAWGFIHREDGHIRLTTLGWDLARKPEAAVQTFRTVLDSVKPYRSALEWIYHQGLTTITNVDVAAQWHEHHSDELGTVNENSIKDSAVCFFHLVEKAELGKLTIGRHGHPTRIDVSQEELRRYIEAGPAAPPWQEESVEPGDDESAELIETGTTGETQQILDGPMDLITPSADALRVFIAHGRNMEIVEQVETMLDVAGFQAEVAEAEETTAIPVPEKVLTAMRRCNAAIVCVTVDEGRKNDGGGYTLNDNVLIEIGSAFVLYDRRVVLVWDKRLPVPSNLQGLYRCEFEGEELTWNAGMKLMKAIRGFNG
jgi:hypothetical protein